jgi:2,4-dienoyl-CoA reductase-like NADH-dependent reductase (Old Yellow Enzyme family)
MSIWPIGCRSPKAVPNDLAAAYYAQRATAGRIVSEGTALAHRAQGFADVPGLYAPEQLAGWKKVPAAVHEAGGEIVSQLWSSDALVSEFLGWHHDVEPTGPAYI